MTPARANYHFNPFNRSFSQVGNRTEAVFAGMAMGDSANPLDTPEYFVRQQYVDILVLARVPGLLRSQTSGRAAFLNIMEHF